MRLDMLLECSDSKLMSADGEWQGKWCINLSYVMYNGINSYFIRD